MNRKDFTITYIALLIAQIFICNYLNLSQFITLNVLPLMILMLPISCSTVSAMIMAFVTGLTLDLLSDGVAGLNAFALVPAALCREGIIRIVFGNEVFARKENISSGKHGPGKMLLASLLIQAVFLVVYIWADGAGTRPLWHNALRFLLSLIVTGFIALPITRLLTADRME